MLVGSPAKWAVMACPCGQGHTIDLNLAHGDREQWKIDVWPQPSISPSVDIKDPSRRCHFWLRDGRVRWV